MFKYNPVLTGLLNSRISASIKSICQSKHIANRKSYIKQCCSIFLSADRVINTMSLTVSLNDIYKIRHIFKLETLRAFNEALQVYLHRLWGPIVILKHIEIGGITEQRLFCVDKSESVYIDVVKFLKTFDQGHFEESSTKELLNFMKAELV